MAINYSVDNRATRPFARWGFALPPPPVRPALFLPVAGSAIEEVFMEETASGTCEGQGQLHLAVKKNFYRGSKPVPLTCAGVWTGGISDCMVVCAAYYNQSQWRRFWFQHVAGGLYNGIIEIIERGIASGDCPIPAHRFAVIAAGYPTGTDDIASKLTHAGIPANNISIYVSGTGARGFNFGVNFSMGLFGEVEGNGTELRN